MSINLVKGQKVDLTKTNPGVKKFQIGLSWEPNTTLSPKDFDLDGTVFILGPDGKVLSQNHIVYYNNQESPEGFVKHLKGDNRDGKAEGDDESLLIDFNKAPANVDSLVVVVTIHEGKENNQNFGQVPKSSVRVLNDETGDVLLNYDLNEDYSVETAVAFCKIYQKDGEYKVEALGTGVVGGLQEYVDKYVG